MLPPNGYMPYHRPFPMPPPEPGTLDDVHEQVHASMDQLPARSTQFRVAAMPTSLPRLKAPSAYTSRTPHYAPYALGPAYRAEPAPFSSASSSSSPPARPALPSLRTPPIGNQPKEHATPAARKRSRHAWPAEMTRQIINVLLDEFLNSPTFQTTIYRSREERDHRFIASGRSILEEYNKVQNIRRRYFIPLCYLLQWDQMRADRSRQRANIEKKLAKDLERNRLQLIFCAASKDKTGLENNDNDKDESPEQDNDGKPVFELDIFVSELKRRDSRLWMRGVDAFHAWCARKCSVSYIINH